MHCSWPHVFVWIIGHVLGILASHFTDTSSHIHKKMCLVGIDDFCVLAVSVFNLDFLIYCWTILLPENKFAVGSGAKTVCICYYEQDNNWYLPHNLELLKHLVHILHLSLRLILIWILLNKEVFYINMYFCLV